MIDKVATPEMTTAAPRQALAVLAARLHGTLVQPGDADYAAARSAFVGTDRAPAAIVRCADASDVAVGLAFARAYGLSPAIRSGGHSLAGHSTSDGVVIDLSPMKAIDLNLERGSVRVEPGCTAGDLSAHLQPYGLALSTGDAGAVGIGGLTLGGGIGWMVRKYGLTIDRLRAVELVTAEGQRLQASAEEHPDLFWGLRGGGGNFGVATAFEFDLHPGGTVLGGAVYYRAANASALLAAYARHADAAPDELSTQATIMRAPPLAFLSPALHGTPILTISVCYAGDLEEGRRVLAPLRRLETPIADTIEPMPYAQLLTRSEGGSMRGLRQRSRSMFLDRLDRESCATIAAHALYLPASPSVAQLRILGGAGR
jgi:FAD/FMN-containing dehydrogenase